MEHTMEYNIQGIGQWLMEENIAYYTEMTNAIYIHSELQLDELDCVLTDWGIAYTVEVCQYCAVYGEYLAFINLPQE
tara:strand:- start:12415 stop:12645 length:231 start_codon:yes stop_codon:yes gene_type:complete